jgi:aminoglycoside 3-N-acetyltransferase
MVHAALRSLGRVIGGVDALIDALCDAVGPTGTVLAYTDWQMDQLAEGNPDLRPDVPPYDPHRSRSIRDNGAFPELLRTTPGSLRSANPGASCTALGGRAQWFTGEHALDYGYGPASPFAKLVEAGGKVLMLGAPIDAMTVLHHAEHLADIAGKRVIRYEAPIIEDDATKWRWFEEFDTSQPVVAGLPDDYFAQIVDAFLATGQGKRGQIARASSIVVEAAPIVAFGKAWLEARFPR